MILRQKAMSGSEEEFSVFDHRATLMRVYVIIGLIDPDRQTDGLKEAHLKRHTIRSHSLPQKAMSGSEEELSVYDRGATLMRVDVIIGVIDPERNQPRERVGPGFVTAHNLVLGGTVLIHATGGGVGNYSRANE